MMMSYMMSCNSLKFHRHNSQIGSLTPRKGWLASLAQSTVHQEYLHVVHALLLQKRRYDQHLGSSNPHRAMDLLNLSHKLITSFTQLFVNTTQLYHPTCSYRQFAISFSSLFSYEAETCLDIRQRFCYIRHSVCSPVLQVIKPTFHLCLIL